MRDTIQRVSATGNMLCGYQKVQFAVLAVAEDVDDFDAALKVVTLRSVPEAVGKLHVRCWCYESPGTSEGKRIGMVSRVGSGYIKADSQRDCWTVINCPPGNEYADSRSRAHHASVVLA